MYRERDFDVNSVHVVRTPVDLLEAAIFRLVGAARPAVDGRTASRYRCKRSRACDLAEYHGHGIRSGAYMIRTGDWKLIYYMEVPHQLFNLIVDPGGTEYCIRPVSGESRGARKRTSRICCPEEENEKAHRFQEEQLSFLSK